MISDWLSGWNNSIRDVVITNSIQNANVSLLKLDDTRINCFITRDISFQRQCSKNGLIFSEINRFKRKEQRVLNVSMNVMSKDVCFRFKTPLMQSNTYKKSDVTWKVQ